MKNFNSDLPNGWAELELGELGIWSGGGTPSKSNKAYWTAGTIPWVSPKDMKSSRVHTAEDSITEDAIANSAAKMIPPDSVLMVTRSGILSHTFPVAVNEKPVAVNQDLKTLTPFQGISSEYLAWYLRSQNSHLLKTCSKHGTTVSSIDTDRLKRYPAPLAPVSEQRRIVDKIDTLFAQLDQGEAALRAVQRQLARYRQSVLKAAVTGELTRDWRAANAHRLEHGRDLLARLLQTRRENWSGRGKYKEPVEPDTRDLPELPAGWVWATVDQLSSSVDYGSSSKCSDESEGVPILRMGNISEGQLDLRNLKYLPTDHPEFPKLLLSPGDILFNRTNSAELVGKTAVYLGTPSTCSFASYLIRVRVSESNPEMISFYINSLLGRQWIKRVVSQQVGQANVNGSKLKSLAVPLPSIAEQEKVISIVGERLNQLDDLESECKSQASRSTALRQSILREAFAGRLVPQDPNDEPASALLERIRASQPAAKTRKGRKSA